jgi:hypothetical protein
MDDLEEILNTLSKPVIPELKHEGRVLEEIMKAKDRLALTWWWSVIPMYIILCLVMKGMFAPRTTFLAEINLFIHNSPRTGIILFVVLPVLSVVINFYAINRIYFWSGRPKKLFWLKQVVFNILWLIVSLAILVVYSIIQINAI